MSLIKQPHEVVQPRTIKILLYGQPGLGKSTLGMSGPNSVTLDFDNGAHRVKLRDRSPVVSVDSWPTVLQLLDSGEMTGKQTIVHDTVGKMLDHMGAAIIAGNSKLGFGGNLSLKGFGERKTMFRNYFHRLTTLGFRVIVFIAHDREERRGDDIIIRPEIGGSSGSDLIRELDLVGYVEAQGNKRTISFTPCERFYAKNTMDLPSIIELPDLDKPGTKNDFLTNILIQRDAAAADHSQKEAAYTDLIDSIHQLVNGITNADQANDFIERMADGDHIWDSKLQASSLLRDRARAIGLTLKDRKYVDPAPQADPLDLGD